MECKCCNCPLKKGGIENLKNQAKEDFNNMLKAFFDKHPYVDCIFLSDRNSYFSQSAPIYNSSDRHITINLK